jgi:ABC-2 type transport system ATP-binding protein
VSDPAVLVENLGKRFGDVVAIEGINLEVPAGTVLGLLGPNGAGKTTTVRILTTILRPDTGRATVLGHDVVTAAQAVRSTIGLAGQFAAVDGNLTGRENLRMVGQLTHQRKELIGPRADELLARFGLADAADRPVRTYSGGMRRRLDLAAALVHKPPVLFLDEPTTGLDPRGRNDLWAVIGELVSDGMTLLLTTQYLEEAERLADRVMVVDGGRVIAEGTPDELKARLGATIIEVRLADPAAAVRARSLLGPTGAAEVLDDGRTVAVTAPDPGRAVLEVVRSLDTASLTPESLAIRAPSLDDVFLQLTGHKAEAGPAETGSAGSGSPEPGGAAGGRAGRGRRRGAA